MSGSSEGNVGIGVHADTWCPSVEKGLLKDGMHLEGITDPRVSWRWLAEVVSQDSGPWRHGLCGARMRVDHLEAVWGEKDCIGG